MATVDWDRANALAQQAVDLPRTDQSQLQERLRPEVATTRNPLGNTFNRSRDILAATLGDESYRFAVVSSDLAATLTLLGHLDDAETAYRKALAINQQTASPNDPEYLLRKCGLAPLAAGCWHL